MAQTTGQVQRLKVTPPPVLAWTYIGPTPTDTELLVVLQSYSATPEDAAFNASLVDALATALVSQTQVKATHGDNDIEISAIEFP